MALLRVADRRLRLGPYTLGRVIGRGGTGLVLQAQREGVEQPLAVKVLVDEASRGPAGLRRFHHEVHAVTRLNHPGIVAVYGYGTTGRGLELGEGALPAGAPYLVMERVEGSSLAPLRGSLTWAGVHRVAVALLEALAHAHARRVIHLDLKPSNVLVKGDLSVIKLGDFGLARWRDLPGTANLASAGTPGYMAPEQRAGRWRDFGAGTDLYALGCLLYALITGAQAPEHILLEGPLLNSPAGIRLPEGFWPWLGRLVEPAWQARWERAADALSALRALDDFIDPDASLLATAIQRLDEVIDDGPTRLDPPQEWSPPRTDAAVERPPVAPFARRWQGPAAPARLPGLDDLAPVPFVGRLRLRDQLWGLLRESAEQGAPRIAVLSGEAGLGKTRLAQWLGQRAEALGAARTLHAFFDEEGGPSAGVGAMLERALCAHGLGGERLLEHLRGAIAEYEVEPGQLPEAIAELIAPTELEISGPRTSTARLRLESPRERFSALARLVEGLGRRRPVVVVLDDLHWSTHLLELTEVLLEVQAPVFVLATLRSESLIPERARRLKTLLARPEASHFEVAPLGTRAREGLLEGVLGLSPEVARLVDTQSKGHPLFALQLFDEWRRRGALHVENGRWRLRSAASAPASLDAVFATRLDELFGAESSERRALELAALLGAEVRDDEWAAACAAQALPEPGALGAQTLREGLSTREPGAAAWRFTHGLLREHLVRQAGTHNRLRHHHKTIAAALQRANSGPHSPAGLKRPEVLSRIGRHWLAAGIPSKALKPLAGAVERHFVEGDHAAIRPLLKGMKRALTSLADADRNEGFGRHRVLAARLARYDGDLEVAGGLATEARRIGHRRGWVKIRIDALVELGEIAHERGRYAQGSTLFEEARALADAQGDPLRSARCRHRLGIAHLGQGALDEAVEVCSDALLDFEAVGELNEAARCELLLGRVLQQCGAASDALDRARAAIERFKQAGSRAGVASASNFFGELARQAGDWEAAERAYRAALERWSQAGHAHAAFARVNLAIVTLERGDPEAARPLLEAAHQGFAAQSRRAVAAQILAFLLAADAELAEWSDFDGRLSALKGALSETGLAEADVARMTQRAGEAALLATEPARARSALMVAAMQWAALDRREALEQVRGALARLPASR